MSVRLVPPVAAPPPGAAERELWLPRGAATLGTTILGIAIDPTKIPDGKDPVGTETVSEPSDESGIIGVAIPGESGPALEVSEPAGIGAPGNDWTPGS